MTLQENIQRIEKARDVLELIARAEYLSDKFAKDAENFCHSFGAFSGIAKHYTERSYINKLIAQRLRKYYNRITREAYL